MIIPAQWALMSGLVLSVFLQSSPNIMPLIKKWSTNFLQISVILLGSSLHFHEVLKEGASGAIITALGISIVFIFGYFGIKFLNLENKLGTLITMGTAICGGSAIAALAPVIGADGLIITISIAIVFLLNSISVFIFPTLGSFLGLSQKAYGTWAALAIHDTSSVIGAASMFGQEALKIATTVKLTRALWIIPITLIFTIKSRTSSKSLKFPWFVLGFLLMSLIFTFLPVLQGYKDVFLFFSKNGFALTLFLIGLTFNYKKMLEVGVKPLIFAILLWAITSSISLFYVSTFIN